MDYLLSQWPALLLFYALSLIGLCSLVLIFGRSRLALKSLLCATPSMFVSIGAMLNAIVIAANHGKMPVAASFYRYAVIFPNGIHCKLTSASRLAWLADVHIVPGRAALSIGDMLNYAGQYALDMYIILLLCAIAWGILLRPLFNIATMRLRSDS